LGKWKWNAYLILEKNISILSKATQVSDVAHGPLVHYDVLRHCECRDMDRPRLLETV
jgi:hypothetical protein